MTCRICKGTNVTDVIDLGEQVITSRFPKYGDFSTPKTKISLFACNDCGLLQLRDAVDQHELYEHEYGYRSGISNTMREHLKAYNSELQSKVTYEPGDSVLDIGSNDSTFLRNYPDTLQRTGIDPTGKQFSSFYDGLELIPNYFTKANIGNRKFKTVSSISMFYDLPDPVQFAKDVHDVLDDEGVWTLEQSYVMTMLERNSIDTICHEHIEYYGVSQIKNIMDRAQLKIIDISTNDCNGGSFRIYVAKRTSCHAECLEKIRSFIDKETCLWDPRTYVEFIKRCKREADKLNTLLRVIGHHNKDMYIYGASTKGNCLLQYADITEDKVKYAVERNLNKVGKMTSTGIPIISEDMMRAHPPDYQLVLPWHFKEEIIAREQKFLDDGGVFVFPFPTLEIVSRKPILLVTGLSGQIGSFVHERFSDTYQVCGIGHVDVSSPEFIEVLNIYAPKAIIHLASVSSTEECEQDPVHTIEINGLAVGKICDWIHTCSPKTRLFNASSSELFRGYKEYTVTDADNLLHPVTMYGIAKSVGHNTVNHYRNTKSIHVSNGILFTTESSRRKNTFLLKKIAEHARSWGRGNTTTPLVVGNIDSSRCLTHAFDAVDAIYRILASELGGNYVICSTTNSTPLRKIIEQIYSLCNVHIVSKGDETYTCSKTGAVVLKIDPSAAVRTDIRGTSDGLKALGWHPRYGLDEILIDIINAR